MGTQASAYKASGVLATLRNLLYNNGSPSMTFQDENQVLAYLGNNILQPIWTDPICGDGSCESPWEFPAWGRFGCHADCGMQTNLTSIAVSVNADFSGHPTLNPRILMANVRWNLCLHDEERRKRGDDDLCW